MTQTVVIVGIGEMGGVFAKGFLRLGYPVYPITRDMNISHVSKHFQEPAFVLIAVAEKDLSEILAKVPLQWIDRLGLLQNELLPHHWETFHVQQPTVVVVWFEKKKGQDCQVILPSRIYGPHSQLLADALACLDIPSKVLFSEEDMLFELALKNTFVLSINIAGLETGGTTGELWDQHRHLVRRVAHEVIDIQEWLIGKSLSRRRLISNLEMACYADSEHQCVGRSAEERLARNVKIADKAGLEISTLREINHRRAKH